MNKDCTTCVEIPADDAPVCQAHGYPMEVGAGFVCDKYRERIPASDPEEDAAALKAGEAVPGASLVEGVSLQIR